MSTPRTTSLVGRTVDGRYEVRGYVAKGGMASVYVAMDTRLDREVALKVMRSDLASDQAFVARFRREARAAARLSHPHVVGVYDQGQDGDNVFLAMELVRGRTLREVIRSDAPLTARAALDVLDPILQALSAAHRADTVHRDVKPENVLIGDDGVVKVADFGLARAITTETLTTNHDVLLGTAAYLAPEQVEHGAADKRSDVYSATLVLHELLTGQKAFGGDSPIHVAYQHVHGEVPRPSSVLAGIPAELDALVTLGAAKKPDARPADAAELLREVRAVRARLSPDELDRQAGADTPPAPPGSSTQAISRSSTSQLRRPPGPAPHGGPGRTQRMRAVDPPAGGGSARTPGARPPDRPPRAGDSVPAKPPAGPAARRRRSAWLGAVLALVLVAGGTGWWFVLGPGSHETVPQIAGQAQGEAVRRLDAVGLSAKVTEVFSETVPKGEVIGSDPGAGAGQSKSSAVVLRVSRGPERLTVPNLAGAAQAQATQQLRATRLTTGPVTQAFSETVPTGRVVQTNPARGAQLKPGAAVALVISKGRQPITVPDLRGQGQDAAGATLTGLGLKVAQAPQAYSDTVPAGSVISHTPASGTLYRGQTVTVTVSKGPELIAVPNVLNKNTAQARQELEAAGFQVKVSTFFGGLLDTVRGQDPRAGTKVRKGTTVTINVV